MGDLLSLKDESLFEAEEILAHPHFILVSGKFKLWGIDGVRRAL